MMDEVAVQREWGDRLAMCKVSLPVAAINASAD